MVSSGIRLKSADDIARARVGVFDDDHPLAYTGGGVGSTQLQCGSSALAPCPDPELRERRSNLRPSLDRLPKPSTVRTLTPRHGGSEDQPLYGVAHWLGRTAPYESIPPRSHAVRGRLHWYRC